MTIVDADPRPRPTNRTVEAPAELRPTVAARPTGSRGLWLTVAAAVLLGVIVFAVLLSRRGDRAPEDAVTLTTPAEGVGAPVNSLAPPSDLLLQPTLVQPTPAVGVAVAPAPTYVPPPPAYVVPSPAPSIVGVPSGLPTLNQRRAAPTLIVDLSGPPTAAELAAASGGAGAGARPGGAGSEGGPASETPAGAAAIAAAVAAGADPEEAAAAVNAAAGGGGGNAGLNTDEQFAARIGSAAAPERVQATRLRNPAFTVPQGALIPGVLETALNSDLPGYARAVVSRDVRSFDGSQVIIPRGSRVIGQYKSGLAEGQSRAFIIWERIIRPDGASIQIASSGTDDLGRAGLAGKVDRKYLQRFGGAILTSVLSAGVAAVSQQPTTSISIGGAGAGGVNVTPSQISPTIKVPQGAPIRIFVARDLDFSTVGGVR